MSGPAGVRPGWRIACAECPGWIRWTDNRDTASEVVAAHNRLMHELAATPAPVTPHREREEQE